MNEAAAQSAIESNYNKEMFQKVLNNEITPGEYARLIKKYKDSAMAEMPEETDIDPEFLASRTIPKGRGIAMSPIEARIAAQERRMGLSMADQPITPSLSTEEVASRMRQSGNLDKRETSIIDRANLRKGAKKYDVGVGVSPSRETEDLINRIQKRQAGDKEFQKAVSLDDLRNQIQAGMGGADAPVTPLTSDMLEFGERSRDKERAAQLANVSNILASRKAMEAGVDEYGTGFGTEQTKLNLPSSVTLDLKPPTSSAPAVAAPTATPAVASTAPDTALDDRIREQGVDDAPYPEGYDAQFADKLDKATTASQYSTSRLPDVEKEVREELFKARQKRATEKGAELEKRRTGLDNDRWLALANLGTSILAQPGGQTFLQALGKGAKDSNIIGTLSKLNREDADLASKIKDIPVELLVSKFKLKKDEAQHVKDATNFELKIAQLEAAKIAATSKAQKDQFDKMIKALNLNIRARNLDFTLKGGKASLTKQENEYLDDFIKTKRNEMEARSPDTYDFYNFWSEDKGKNNRANIKQAFKDYARRNKSTDINTNWDNFIKKYK
jgi:hypothetical protein